MANQNILTRELPKYLPRRPFRALKIAKVELLAGPYTGAMLHPAEAGFDPFTVSEDYLAREGPLVGGYYVQQPEGRELFMYAEVFERHYVASTVGDRTRFIVNGQIFSYPAELQRETSYDEIVSLAGMTGTPKVTWRNARVDRGGSLRPGSGTFIPVDGDMFKVSTQQDGEVRFVINGRPFMFPREGVEVSYEMLVEMAGMCDEPRVSWQRCAGAPHGQVLPGSVVVPLDGYIFHITGTTPV